MSEDRLFREDYDVKDIKESTFKKLPNFICPECGEITLININDYKIKISGCKNGHVNNDILFSEFGKNQNIDVSKILCDNCKNSNISDINNDKFYFCFDCKQNLCENCNINHINNHKRNQYINKFYICEEHNDFYDKYCQECKKNICPRCEQDHNNHGKLSLISHSNKVKTDLMNIRRDINLFNDNISIIINKLNKVRENIEVFYNIYINIITNYGKNKCNYELYQNFQDNYILKDICDINKEINTNDKIKGILKMYKKMVVDEITIKYNIKNDETVKIFGKRFVKNNKNICKIICEDKEYELIDTFETKNLNKENLEIKLKGISEITDISSLFDKCSSLSSSTNLSKWDTSNIIDMSYIFSNCDSLEHLPDISNWNTSNVKYMKGIFRGCKNLKELPDISKWDTSKVIYMGGGWLLFII